jgi:hypothetical protein
MDDRSARTRTWGAAAVWVAAWLLVRPSPAHAYLDPGSGSYLLQLAAAAVFASMFTVRLYWQKFKDWARGVRPAAKSEIPEAPKDGRADSQ